MEETWDIDPQIELLEEVIPRGSSPTTTGSWTREEQPSGSGWIPKPTAESVSLSQSILEEAANIALLHPTIVHTPVHPSEIATGRKRKSRKAGKRSHYYLYETWEASDVKAVIDMDGYTLDYYYLIENVLDVPDFVHKIRCLHHDETADFEHINSSVFVCRELGISQYKYGKSGEIRDLINSSFYFRPPVAKHPNPRSKSFKIQASICAMPWTPDESVEQPVHNFSDLGTVVSNFVRDLSANLADTSPVVVGYKGGSLEKDLLEVLGILHFNLENVACPIIDQLLHQVRPCASICHPTVHSLGPTRHCPRSEVEAFMRFLWDLRTERRKKKRNATKRFKKRESKRRKKTASSS